VFFWRKLYQLIVMRFYQANLKRNRKYNTENLFQFFFIVWPENSFVEYFLSIWNQKLLISKRNEKKLLKTFLLVGRTMMGKFETQIKNLSKPFYGIVAMRDVIFWEWVKKKFIGWKINWERKSEEMWERNEKWKSK
jgi:hypothetical protein